MRPYLQYLTDGGAKQSTYCGAQSNKGLANNTQQFVWMCQNKASSPYKEIKTSLLCLILIDISRFFTKYCIMQYFTCKYCKQISVCVMQKIIICKNVFIMLSIVQIHIIFRKRELSQKVFELLHPSLCLLVDGSTDRALLVFVYFL